MTKKIGLDDIAKAAGVSRATVSRAMNDASDISDKTRQRILEVVQQLNYRPNLVARALAKNRTGAISLVIPHTMASTFTEPFFPTIANVALTARQSNYAFMLWMNDGSENDEQFCERILNNALSDGILLVSSFLNDPLIPRLTQSGFPFVLIGPTPDNVRGVHAVDFDDKGGALAAVSHLTRLGRRRIGIITGPMKTFPAQRRLSGYRDVLTHENIPIDESLIVEGDYTQTSGYTRTTILLSRKVDAIFVTSDVMAIGALQAIQAAGLRVPEDVSVVGFDGIFVDNVLSPKLTTIRQPIEHVATLATQALIDLIDGKLTEPYQVMLPVELVVRESCGASLRMHRPNISR